MDKTHNDSLLSKFLLYEVQHVYCGYRLAIAEVVHLPTALGGVVHG